MENTADKPQQPNHKRHCMVVHAYYPLAETRVQREAEALLAHGFEVDVICLRLPGENTFEVARGVNVHRLPIQTAATTGLIGQLWEYFIFIIMAAYKLTKLHRQKHYQVIQVHNLPDYLVFCALIPKLGGTPIILDIHDVSPELLTDRTGHAPDSMMGQLAVWQEQLSCRFANHVITVTEPWRQLLIQRGVPKEKTSVVMNMADAKLFHSGVRQQLNGKKPQNTFHLIYHGVQTYKHGLDLLLKAVHQTRSQIPELRLTLHGEGDFHEDLVAMVNELDLADIVHFSNNYVPISELPALIATADIGVVPYRRGIFSDGILPTKLMEYTALGMPAIVSRTPAIEAYFDEIMVEFFTPDNADDLARCLLKLHSDKQRVTQLIEGAKKFRERYNWENISAEYATRVERMGNK